MEKFRVKWNWGKNQVATWWKIEIDEEICLKGMKRVPKFIFLSPFSDTHILLFSILFLTNLSSLFSLPLWSCVASGSSVGSVGVGQAAWRVGVSKQRLRRGLGSVRRNQDESYN